MYDNTRLKTILPWTIVAVSEDYTFQQFYEAELSVNYLQSSSADRTYSLRSALVGVARDQLDTVELGLYIYSVVCVFGRFLRYVVVSSELMVVAQQSRNAFSVMMASQRSLSQKPLPDAIVERNKKDALYNAFLEFLRSRNLSWSSDECCTVGAKLIHTISDVLWHIDDHHQTISRRSTPIPAIFSEFQGYNDPVRSKHRKRQSQNMSSTKLSDLASILTTSLQANFWDREGWNVLKSDVSALACALAGYAQYLNSKCKSTKLVHASPRPVREISDNLRVKFISSSSSLDVRVRHIEESLCGKEPYEFVNITEFLPTNAMQKHRLVEHLTTVGLSFPSVLLVYAPGSNVGNLHFVWRSSTDDASAAFEQSIATIERVKQLLPSFHTRAMRRAMFEKFGRFSHSVKPAMLRYFYCDLTGDSSASETTAEGEVDRRVLQFLEMEDPDILLDLRAVNSGQKSKYDLFWDECGKYLNEEVCAAVDDRRHTQITHLARAISVRDLISQVESRCSPGTPIPSNEWVRLQFWPKTPAKRKLGYTGKFKIKYMVQQRQWRHSHPDTHYAAALFRYMREYAVQFRSHCGFVCLDDKHRIKVGEPGFPVAAAERGRRVMVGLNESLTVGDHDFTKFGIIPSVTLLCDIPEDVTESWYGGQVFVLTKDSAFEPSSPLRHACELANTLHNVNFNAPILFLYTDGGPDHRLTYVSVQLSLICLFLQLDLDYLCAGRTAPFHSWRNPVERIMSLLNLGLQCVGLARKEMPEKYEAEGARCNSLLELRKIAEKTPQFPVEVKDSLSPVHILLSTIFSRLDLKGKCVKSVAAASQDELTSFWSAIMAIDSTLAQDGCYTQKEMKGDRHKQICDFIAHCCQPSHYSFDILKCGSESCTLCRPIRLPKDVFDKLHHIPHPTPGADDHYLAFSEVFGKDTSDNHRPSLTAKKSRKNTLPFQASVQHVKNAMLMLQCEECEMWRLIFSKFKLDQRKKKHLQKALEQFTYTCGARLSSLDLGEEFKNVEVRVHSCYDPIEKLYYSAGFDPICVYCASVCSFSSEDFYPQCSACSEHPPVSKK